MGCLQTTFVHSRKANPRDQEFSCHPDPTPAGPQKRFCCRACWPTLSRLIKTLLPARPSLLLYRSEDETIKGRERTSFVSLACFQVCFEGDEASGLLAGEAEPQVGREEGILQLAGRGKAESASAKGPLAPPGAAGAASALPTSAHLGDSPHPKALAAPGTCNSSPSFFFPCTDTGHGR